MAGWLGVLAHPLVVATRLLALSPERSEGLSATWVQGPCPWCLGAGRHERPRHAAWQGHVALWSTRAAALPYTSVAADESLVFDPVFTRGLC